MHESIADAVESWGDAFVAYWRRDYASHPTPEGKGKMAASVAGEGAEEHFF